MYVRIAMHNTHLAEHHTAKCADKSDSVLHSVRVANYAISDL